MKTKLWKPISLFRSYSSSTTNLLTAGDILRECRVFTSSDIAEYSSLTHDNNPLHFDPQSARNAGFKDLPVPGMLVASLFPRIIASRFPVAVYAKQTLEFRLPVFVGERIIGEIKACNIRQIKEAYMVKFTTTCLKDGESVVIEGEALAILPCLTVKTV